MARHTLLTSRSILWNTLARGARVSQPGWSTRLCLSRPRTSRLRVARTHIPVGWDFFFSGITCVYSGDGFWDSPCLSRRRLRAHEIPSGELGRLVNRRYCVGRVWDAIVTVQGLPCATNVRCWHLYTAGRTALVFWALGWRLGIFPKGLVVVRLADG